MRVYCEGKHVVIVFHIIRWFTQCYLEWWYVACCSICTLAPFGNVARSGRDRSNFTPVDILTMHVMIGSGMYDATNCT